MDVVTSAGKAARKVGHERLRAAALRLADADTSGAMIATFIAPPP